MAQGVCGAKGGGERKGYGGGRPTVAERPCGKT